MSYAIGKKALGICDRCGFTYKLNELFYQIENSIRNGQRVCTECLDEDQPQLKLGELNTSDAQSLYNSRPDSGKAESKMGSRTMGLTMHGKVGKLTVSTS